MPLILTKRQRSKIADEIISKSERQMNISETGRMLDLLKQADYEDNNADVKKISDPQAQHDWVNIAIDFRMRNLARCDFKLMTGKKEITSGPVFDLFENVNPYMSKYELWEATEAWRMVRGEAIWILTGENQSTLKQNTIPQEIIIADPTHFKLTFTANGKNIWRWLWFEKIEDMKENSKGIPFSPYEIIHFKIWNKWNYWRGVSFWKAQMENIEQDYQAGIQNTSLIKNRSIPAGILSSEQIITDDQAKKLIDTWEKRHKGAKKSHKIAVLGHATKYQAIAQTMAEMQYFDMKKWNRLTILAKAGIPPILFGIKDEHTALSGQDTTNHEKAFWTKTMFPEQKMIEDKLRTNFFNRFNLQMEGKFDISNIEELQEDFGAKVERAHKLFNMSFTRNEINEKLDLGFKKVDWGDKAFIPGMTKEINAEEESGTGPPPFPPPAAEPPAEPPPARSKSDRWIIGYILESRQEWEKLENRYRATIQKWLYEQRKYFLNRYGKNIIVNVNKTYEEFMFWVEQEKLLKNISQTFFLYAMDQVGKDIVTIFRQTEWATEFDFFQTDIDRIVNTRLDMVTNLVQTTKQAIDTTIRNGMKEGFTTEQMANALRNDFKSLGKHADTIAKTEMGLIKSDSQATAYAEEKVEEIDWIHTGGGKESRPDHIALDGQRRLYLQEPFETAWGSLMYPRDPNGAPGDIINCYCDFIPVPPKS